MNTFYFEGPLEINKVIHLKDASEIRHAFTSLRKKENEIIEIINGFGEKFQAKIVECSAKIFSVLPIDRIETDVEYNDLQVAIAIAVLNKSSKMKLLIEKLTEIGIHQFIPLITDRTSFPKAKTESLQATMISALKQCGGTKDVKIQPNIELNELISTQEFDEKYFADIDGKILNVDYEEKNIKLLITIGPEGGFTNKEKKMLTQNNFKPIRLNKRILRAETAAIVAASRVLN
ncbi:MAG: RsmE family RNA methyltransferase [Candidatus Delongbacteria bacterium]|jgi:16S rRNA (uracil1498-N3)-methyltransferase|nr:RsmE family RNA methyltransferase [Candidatus Delongbacteria bacterium]